MDITALTLTELAHKTRNGEISSTAAVTAYLDAARAGNPRINGYITICEKEALTAATAADNACTCKPWGPLHGVPIALKDNLSTEGVRTTCASKILENYMPVFDATVVTRLKAAGAVILGKTNCDEFAMGSSNENSYFGPVKNPLDVTRIPGGSSGGSAAVVAARMAPAALGSDTGGSIRQPAACCGVVGLKPTYGRVSRYGLVAYASSLDQIGPLTRNVEDAALLLSVIAGPDDRDSTAARLPVPDYRAVIASGVRGMRIGLPQEYFAEGLDPEIKAAVLEAAEALKAQGAELAPVSLPHTRFAVAAYYILAPAEATSNLARFDGVKYGAASTRRGSLDELYRASRSEGFGREVKRRIMLGNYVLSSGYYDAYYRKAQQVRALISRDFDRAFEMCDVLMGPVMPTPPFRLGEKLDDPLAMYLSDIYTLSLNLAGLPGISVPFGKAGGMPVGVQFVAKGFDEAAVLCAGAALEKAAR
ncbi:MAG: Asp-tRNA(Asn)/Glu-tRNA(Gln) amidotransferase subunit GatA [Fibrobacterota bacterium]